MIAPPPGWTSTRVPKGMRLVPPEGEALGEVRYHLRTPLAELRGVLGKMVRPEPGFEAEPASPPEHLITDEGEFATLFVQTGRLGGVRIQRATGLVFGDDFFTQTSSICRDEAQFERFHAAVREMVVTDTLVLGELRRRVYHYRAPKGWRGEEFDFEVTWTPPPGQHPGASITVFPALPTLGTPPEVLDGLVVAATEGGRFAVSEIVGPTAQVTALGLAGKSWELRGHFGDQATVVRAITLLTDDRFVYRVRLEVPEIGPQLRELYASLIESVEPLPVPRRGRGSAALAAQWAE